MSWRTALKITVVTGVLGAGLLSGSTIINAHAHATERRTTAEVDGVTNCERQACSYSVFYTDSHGLPELASIPGPQGQAQPYSKTPIYYQDANPSAARFPGTGYESSNLDTLTGLSVMLILFATFMLLVTLAKGILSRRR